MDSYLTSLLITIKDVINLVSVLFLLPQISPLVRRYTSPVRSDLLIVKGSVCLLILGTSLMVFFIILEISPSVLLSGPLVGVTTLPSAAWRHLWYFHHKPELSVLSSRWRKALGHSI